MEISQAGIDLIKQFEGFSAKPYLCPAGKLTIGYGHVITAKEDFCVGGIDVFAAERLLKQDVSMVGNAVSTMALVAYHKTNSMLYVALPIILAVKHLKNLHYFDI